MLILFMFGRDLNIMLTGDEAASSLGIDTVKIKNILIVISAILIAASVSVSGAIGFVGLIIALPLTSLLLAYYQRYIIGEKNEQTPENAKH